MTYDLSDMPSIDREDLRRLHHSGVKTTGDVLDAMRDRLRLDEIERRSGVSLALLVRWARFADLTRVMGLTPMHAELLDACGVWSLEELRRERAASLARRLNRRNAQLGYVQGLIRELQVDNWIAQARRMRAQVA